jgi:hypothetical protein
MYDVDDATEALCARMEAAMRREIDRALASLEERLERRLARIEEHCSLAVVKEAYTVQDAAARLGLTPYTVREWCRLGQARAAKVKGEGRRGELRIDGRELARLQAEGPSPIRTFDNQDEPAVSLAG